MACLKGKAMVKINNVNIINVAEVDIKGRGVKHLSKKKWIVFSVLWTMPDILINITF